MIETEIEIVWKITGFSPFVTMCYLDIHPANILLAFFWLHPFENYLNISPFTVENSTRRLQNSKRTGCSVQSGSVARDRRNCFGIDARGLWLFPGQGQFVPTRARHTPALHTFTHLEQTQDGFLWTHTRVCQNKLRASPLPNFQKTLPLVKIYFCTQVTSIATF